MTGVNDRQLHFAKIKTIGKGDKQKHTREERQTIKGFGSTINADQIMQQRPSCFDMQQKFYQQSQIVSTDRKLGKKSQMSRNDGEVGKKVRLFSNAWMNLQSLTGSLKSGAGSW